MFESLSREESEELLLLLEEKENRHKYNFISTLFPDTGELRRELYSKHIAFLNAGADYTERSFIAGNRCGKTLTGLFELVTHCTGIYPHWWEGKRFNRPVTCWLVGDRGDTIRDGMQKDLCGRDGMGTGLIPKDAFIGTPSSLQGTPQGYGIYSIKHKSGGTSQIVVKTYNAGKNAFESASVDVVMLDEEVPMDIYVECQMRTLTTGGTVYNTFTPDTGLTDTVLHFLEKPKAGEAAKFVVMVGWDDVPHLNPELKAKLLATIPTHMRDCKTKGIPYHGSGAIFPIPEEDITCQSFKIPEYWPKAYSFDPGWNRTAALWGAYDEETDTWYLYAEYYRGQAEPEIHTANIKAKGDWIDGVSDPHGSKNGKGVSDQSFLEAYEKYGLNLMLAQPSGKGSVEIGINEVYSRLSTGRLKIFSNLYDWFYEYRMYRRDDNGKVVAKNNHLMDCTRYLMLCGHMVMKTFTDEDDYRDDQIDYDADVSSITGY